MIAVALGLLLAPASTVTVEDRTEARGRIVAAGEGAADLETQPTVRLDVRGRHGADTLALAVAPRLVLTRPEGSSVRGEALALASLRLDVERRRVRVLAQQAFAYGAVSAGTLLVQPRTAPGEVPASPFPFPLDGRVLFTLLSSQSAVGVGYALSPRLAVSASASYFVYGGPDPESRRQLALSSGPSAEARLDAHLTRRDDAAAVVGARYTRLQFELQPGPSSSQGFGEARLRHRFSRLTWAEAGAGATVQAVEGFATSLYPSGDAALVTAFQQRSAHGELAFVARTGPWLNIFTGAVSQRVEGIVAARWVFGRNTLFAESAAQSTVGVTGVGEYRLLLGSAGYGRALSRQLSVDVGVRAGVQEVETCAARAEVLQLSAVVGLRYAAVPWRLR